MAMSTEKNWFARILVAGFGGLGFQALIYLALITAIYYSKRLAGDPNPSQEKGWARKERHTMTGAALVVALLYAASCYMNHSEKQRIQRCIRETERSPYWISPGEPKTASSIAYHCMNRD
ncbi:hypothetical protein ACQKGO_33195 [Corallococcus interemptor]|uniref:hypothetical protein n=1 Tax=Corallococcus interemptor TaxID=2316720 RepID=UPI003CFE6873